VEGNKHTKFKTLLLKIVGRVSFLIKTTSVYSKSMSYTDPPKKQPLHSMKNSMHKQQTSLSLNIWELRS